MPDNITYNTIPIDIRTPGQYIEIDNSKALRGLPGMNRRMLFIGNKLAAGTAAAGTLKRINAGSEAAGYFGRGSVLHEMLVAARNANKTSDIWAIGLDDLGAGVAATFTATVTGPATGSGVIPCTSTASACRSGWWWATRPRRLPRRSPQPSPPTRAAR